MLQRDIYLRQIERLIAFEKQAGVTSIFLLGSSQRSFGLHDLRYRAGSSAYRELLVLLKDHETGLHSTGSTPIEDQLRWLGQFTGKPVRFHRSHFFKFDRAALYPVLEAHGITTDFSEGEARRVNFTLRDSGEHHINVVPTVISDNAFFYHDPREVFKAFRKNLNNAASLQTDIAVLWHPENMLIEPKLLEYYHEIILICKSHNYHFIPTL